MSELLSVPTEELEAWYEIGWDYVKPDFDKPDHSFIAWRQSSAAVKPFHSVTSVQRGGG